jgi:hypothetical protein
MITAVRGGWVTESYLDIHKPANGRSRPAAPKKGGSTVSSSIASSDVNNSGIRRVVFVRNFLNEAQPLGEDWK